MTEEQILELKQFKDAMIREKMKENGENFENKYQRQMV